MSQDRALYSVNAGYERNLGAELVVPPGASESGVAVVEHTLAPGKLAAPLHRHTNEDEISYVRQGTMGVQEGDEVSTVSAGEFAVKERGVWHTFWNAGDEELRFLELIAPGAFAWYFEEAAEILPEDGHPDEEQRKRLAELHHNYELEVDPDSVPELIERHDLE